MTPKEFAKLLRDTHDCREASFDKSRMAYRKSYTDAAHEVCPQPWAPLIAILLHTGFADVDEWCEAVERLQ